MPHSKLGAVLGKAVRNPGEVSYLAIVLGKEIASKKLGESLATAGLPYLVGDA